MRKLGLSITTLLAAVTFSQATIAQAQTIDQSQQHIKGLANLYALSTYADGANEVCDLFLNGEFAAFQILRGKIATDLRRAMTSEQLAAINSTDKGKQDWKSCPSRASGAKQWELIDSAALLSDALIAAPAAIAGDPKNCIVEGRYRKLSKFEWSYAANVRITKYASSPRKAEFEGLRKSFADMIDAECNRNSISGMMRAGHDALMHSEDINLFFQKGLEKKQVFTSVGTSISTNYLSGHLGIWRSKQGNTGAYGYTDGLNVFRILSPKDEKIMFFHLASTSTFGARGKMFVTRTGRWLASLESNVDNIELRFSDGKTFAMQKQSGSGTAALGSAEFSVPADVLKKIAGLPNNILVTIAHRTGEKPWAEFLDIGSGANVQKIRLGQIREGMTWSNVPRADWKAAK